MENDQVELAIRIRVQSTGQGQVQRAAGRRGNDIVHGGEGHRTFRSEMERVVLFGRLIAPGRAEVQAVFAIDVENGVSNGRIVVQIHRRALFDGDRRTRQPHGGRSAAYRRRSVEG